MNKAFEKLISVAGDALLPQWHVNDEEALAPFGRVGGELLEVLQRKNGLFAFESALHVLPLGSGRDFLNLGLWNNPKSWKAEFGDLVPPSLLFFAQDVYGNQFYIRNDEVGLFYPEFAEIEPLAKSLAEWGDIVLSDWRGFSGYDLGHEWQVLNGPLSDGERLIPKIPFVLGGKYEVNNLYAGQIVDAMRFRASVARQIAGLPDGTAIDLKII